MNIQTFIKGKMPFIIFLLSFFTMAFLYNYQESSFYRPQSFHAWRQADCASITLNYYQDSLPFFQPQVHNLTSGGGTSGSCATSEIPFLYYFVSKLYALFGPYEFFIRFINLIIWFAGLFYTMKILQVFIKNYFWSISAALTIFTAPVLIYYGNNYLTNVSAISIAIIAWYIILRLYHDYSWQRVLLALFMIFLAAGFKISALMSFISLFIVLIISLLNRNDFALRRGRVFFTAGFFAILLLMLAWIYWVSSYNSSNDCTYFSTRIFPLWDLSPEKISEVIISIRTLWLPDYFHWSMLLLGIIGILLIIKYRKFLPWEVHTFNLILLGGALLYILLQFFTFRDHDYYVIDLYILWIAVMIQTFYIFKKQFSTLFSSGWMKVAWILFLGYNVYYAAGRQAYRYEEWPNAYAVEYQSLYSSEPFLRQLGISYQDKVVFIPDPTNVSLYLMNQKGWTQYTDQRFNEGIPVRYNQDSAGFEKSISNGAKYLIIKDMAVLNQFEWLLPYANYLMGEYNNMLVFDLKQDSTNFDVHRRIYSEVFSFNMEQGTHDLYESISNQIRIPSAGSRDSTVSFSGTFSCKLNSTNPYGLTYEFDHKHKWNKQYQIEVMRRGNQNAGIVFALDGSNEFYQMNSQGEPIPNSDWSVLRWNVTIPPQFDGRRFKLYLYNPGEELVWFDDFQFSTVEVGEVH